MHLMISLTLPELTVKKTQPKGNIETMIIITITTIIVITTTKLNNTKHINVH